VAGAGLRPGAVETLMHQGIKRKTRNSPRENN
jgi:hypothetical protein